MQSAVDSEFLQVANELGSRCGDGSNSKRVKSEVAFQDSSKVNTRQYNLVLTMATWRSEFVEPWHIVFSACRLSLCDTYCSVWDEDIPLIRTVNVADLAMSDLPTPW